MEYTGNAEVGTLTVAHPVIMVPAQTRARRTRMI
jgi:hypothetical protein